MKEGKRWVSIDERVSDKMEEVKIADRALFLYSVILFMCLTAGYVFVGKLAESLGEVGVVELLNSYTILIPYLYMMKRTTKKNNRFMGVWDNHNGATRYLYKRKNYKLPVEYNKKEFIYNYDLFSRTQEAVYGNLTVAIALFLNLIVYDLIIGNYIKAVMGTALLLVAMGVKWVLFDKVEGKYRTLLRMTAVNDTIRKYRNLDYKKVNNRKLQEWIQFSVLEGMEKHAWVKVSGTEKPQYTEEDEKMYEEIKNDIFKDIDDNMSIYYQGKEENSRNLYLRYYETLIKA